jgi:hypothetical protein
MRPLALLITRIATSAFPFSFLNITKSMCCAKAIISILRVTFGTRLSGKILPSTTVLDQSLNARLIQSTHGSWQTCICTRDRLRGLEPSSVNDASDTSPFATNASGVL